MNFSTSNKKVPVYVYVMLAVTLAYLTIEVPFSVHLIEFMGGNPSLSDIDDIEFFGRILTGCAVAIFVVGAIVLPRMNFRRSKFRNAFWIAVWTSLSIGGTFNALNYIADYLGASSTPEQRRVAFQTNVIKRQIAQNGVGDIAMTDTSDWLTFVSAIPSLGASADELFEMSNVARKDMIREEAYRALGSLEDGRKQFSTESRTVSKEIYAQYQVAVGKYHEALQELNREANRAVSKFEDAARKKANGLWYWYDKEKKAEVARTEFRKHGLHFTNKQNPLDRDVFAHEFGKKYKVEVRASFDKGIREQFGSVIDPDLGFEEFFSHPAVHNKLRSVFKLPKSSIPLGDTMSDADFSKLVYEPLASSNADIFARAFDAPATQFANGNEFEKLGTNAVKMIQVPVMAILLSIAGAMLHIYKFSTYLIQILAGRTKLQFINTGVRHALGFSVMASAFIFMGMSGNVVTSNAAFAQIKSGAPVAHLMHGAIAIQPEFSKLGRGLGSIGPWNLIVSHLPAPVLYENTKIAKAAIAPVVEQAAMEAENITLENIPVPTPRPDRESN